MGILEILGALAVALAVGLGLGRRVARRETDELIRKRQEADHEEAEDIRRRVTDDRAERLRELDDAGWRDE